MYKCADAHRVNFAITNNLGDVLFRSFVWTFAQCTSSTLSLAITRNNRKKSNPQGAKRFCVRDGEIITGKRLKLYLTYRERRLTHN